MRDAVVPTWASANSVTLAALHHLRTGGNRLRANLALHAGNRLRLRSEESVTVATICEMLHNASLIQDDLIDRAPVRRGAPSVWVAFDDATAVCVSDLFLSGAFALVGELSRLDLLPALLAQVHRRTLDVILGQGAEQATQPGGLDAYEVLAAGKSASLLSLPTELPLMMSDLQQYLPSAKLSARAFAVAYQMLDDLADFEEDLRSGALNAVSVALRMDQQDYRSACMLVCDRAEGLLEVSIEQASYLPLDCGAALVQAAQTMREAIDQRRQESGCSAERLPHAG